MLENKRKEYIQLSVAITRAKKAGKNITELLIQRQKLISERPNQTKSREQINRNYYRKNKEILQKQARSKKEEEKEREQERREQAVKVLATKLYEVNNIKVLMSFKAYTELSKEKKKLWVNFRWTIKDLEEMPHSIVQIMKIREEADNLIRDYRETATNKERSDERSWNLLDYDEQQKLIKYWAREKFHQEQGLAAKLEWQESRGQEWERKIKLAKFHEERGKEGCSCYDCKEKKEIRREVKQRYDAYWQEKEKPGEREEVENEYGECYENKMVSVESGLCRKCERELEKKA